MTGLTLVWDKVRDLPAVPLTEHCGRAVTWDDWHLAPNVTHIVQKCEQADCLHEGQKFKTTGTVHPAEGDTILAPSRERRTGSGRTYGALVRRPAHPVRSLHAFCCARCRHIDVYEMTDRDFVPVDLVQGVLF
ncbi:hypothetical protein [Kribbella deserti]|uniref:Uncharacterized protein n=1 Tax=Kribbella deserti TaxID=1926257 RepID=A0ABV6QND8_9ACTN